MEGRRREGGEKRREREGEERDGGGARTHQVPGIFWPKTAPAALRVGARGTQQDVVTAATIGNRRYQTLPTSR